MIITKLKEYFLLCLALLVFCVPAFADNHSFFMSQNYTAVIAAGGGIDDPTDISGCLVWTDAINAAATYSNDDPVSTWTNDGSDAADAVQGTSDNQPLFKTNVIDTDKPGILYDGINDFLRCNIANITQPSTHFIIFTTQSGSDNIFDGISGGRQTVVETSGRFYQYGGGSSQDSGITYGVDTYCMLAFFDGDNSYIRIDGIDGSVANCGTDGVADLSLGTTSFKGYIHAYALYNNIISPDSIADLEAYASRYGL